MTSYTNTCPEAGLFLRLPRFSRLRLRCRGRTASRSLLALVGNRAALWTECRQTGPLPFRPARIAASVGRTRMWIRRSLRACRSCRAGGQTRRGSVAVRMKADAPGQDGVRRRIQRGELLLDAGFDIDRDQPQNGVLRRRVPVKIERNERQRCLIKNAGSWGLWSRAEPEKRRNHSGATTGLR